MKIAGIADIHMCGKRRVLQNEKLHRAFGIMKWQGVSWVLNAGDTFDCGHIYDSAGTVPQILQALLEPVEQHNIPVLTILGNHDLLDAKKTALDALRGHRLFACVEYPSSHYIRKGSELVRVLCLPWQDPVRLQGSSSKRNALYLANLQANSTPGVFTVLLGHAEIEGAMGDSYRTILPGANYVLSQRDVDVVGADLNWFGHYHARQPYYLGAFLRSSFGEAQNPDGFCIYDTEKQQETWYDVGGPRYYKVAMPEVDDLLKNVVRAGDQVLIVQADPGEVVLAPEGVEVRLEPASRAVKPQERISLSDESLAEAVEQWAHHSLQRVPSCAEYAQAVEELENLPDVVRAPLIPSHLQCVTLQGVGPHEDLSVQFEDGWNVLLGENGAGKSYVLEALVCAIWGTWVHRERPISQVCDRESGYLSVEFRTQEGSEWQITRTYRKGKSLGVLVGCDGELVAGGNKIVEKAEEYLAERFGKTPGHHLGTWMLSQTAEKDLTESRDADRMAWIRNWLGLGRYTKFAEHCTKRRKERLPALAVLRSAREDLARVNGSIAEIRAVYQQANENRNALQRTYHAAVKEHSERQQQFLEATKTQDAISDLQEVLRKLSCQELSLEERAKTLREWSGSGEDPAAGPRIAEELQRLRLVKNTWEVHEQDIASREYSAKRVDYAACKDLPGGCLDCVLIQDSLDARRWIEEAQANPPERWTEEHVVRTKELLRRRNAILTDETERLRNSGVLEEVVRQIALVRDKAREVQEKLQTLLQHPRTLTDQQRQDMREEVQVLYSRAQDVEQQLHEAQRGFARAQGNLEATERQLRAVEEKVNAGLSAEVWDSVWAFLELVCGKNGIPQLLIAQQLPALQERLNEINQQDLEGQFQIELSTLRELQDGRQAETFGITINGRDVRSESGGRRSLARLVLRAALQDTGGLLIADEPTAAQDTKNLEYTVALLSRLSSRFDQVIVSTHSPLLAQQIPNRIEI